MSTPAHNIPPTGVNPEDFGGPLVGTRRAFEVVVSRFELPSLSLIHSGAVEYRPDDQTRVSAHVFVMRHEVDGPVTSTVQVQIETDGEFLGASSLGDDVVNAEEDGEYFERREWVLARCRSATADSQDESALWIRAACTVLSEPEDLRGPDCDRLLEDEDCPATVERYRLRQGGHTFRNGTVVEIALTAHENETDELSLANARAVEISVNTIDRAYFYSRDAEGVERLELSGGMIGEMEALSYLHGDTSEGFDSFLARRRQEWDDSIQAERSGRNKLTEGGLGELVRHLEEARLSGELAA